MGLAILNSAGIDPKFSKCIIYNHPSYKTAMAMDMEYGVKVFNKFDISALGEDDDPYEILKRAEAKKKDEKAKEAKEKATKSVSKSGKQSKKDKVTSQEQQKNRQNEVSSLKQDGENRPPRREQSGRQDRGGKFQREFDRHSGSDRTGIKPVEKRGG